MWARTLMNRLSGCERCDLHVTVHCPQGLPLVMWFAVIHLKNRPAKLHHTPRSHMSLLTTEIQNGSQVHSINFSCKTPSRVSRAPTSALRFTAEIATTQISATKSQLEQNLIESRTGAHFLEVGGAFASAIGQESRQNKFAKTDFQNQIWSSFLTLGHHPTNG